MYTDNTVNRFKCNFYSGCKVCFRFFTLTSSTFGDFHCTIKHKLKMWCPEALMLRTHYNPHQEQNLMWTPFLLPLGYAVWLSQWSWQTSLRLNEKQDNSAFLWQQEKMQENTINSLLLPSMAQFSRACSSTFSVIGMEKRIQQMDIQICYSTEATHLSITCQIWHQLVSVL